MYELRYYFTISDLKKNNTKYNVVGTYGNAGLAYGMRKKKAKEPQYSANLLKVVKV